MKELGGGGVQNLSNKLQINSWLIKRGEKENTLQNE